MQVAESTPRSHFITVPHSGGTDPLKFPAAYGSRKSRIQRFAVLALTVAPYSRDTVNAVAFASERGVAIIAITDNLTSRATRKR